MEDRVPLLQVASKPYVWEIYLLLAILGIPLASAIMSDHSSSAQGLSSDTGTIIFLITAEIPQPSRWWRHEKGGNAGGAWTGCAIWSPTIQQITHISGPSSLQLRSAMLSRVLRAWVFRVPVPLANPRTHWWGKGAGFQAWPLISCYTLVIAALLKTCCISLFHFCSLVFSYYLVTPHQQWLIYARFPLCWPKK